MPMRLLTSLLLVFFFATSLLAQNDGSELGVGFGFSPTSTKGIGVTLDRQFLLTSVSYSHILTGNEDTVLKYRFALVPAAFVRHGDLRAPDGSLIPARAVYGGGLEPIGLQVNFRRATRVQPYVGTSGGFL